MRLSDAPSVPCFLVRERCTFRPGRGDRLKIVWSSSAPAPVAPAGASHSLRSTLTAPAVGYSRPPLPRLRIRRRKRHDPASGRPMHWTAPGSDTQSTFGRMCSCPITCTSSGGHGMDGMLRRMESIPTRRTARAWHPPPATTHPDHRAPTIAARWMAHAPSPTQCLKSANHQVPFQGVGVAHRASHDATSFAVDVRCGTMGRWRA